MTVIYAYAITRPTARLSDLSDVDLLTAGDLAMAVSEISLEELDNLDEAEITEQSRLARLARRHDAVVRAVAASAPSLPLRFGTVLTDRTAATSFLTSRRKQAEAALERIADHREWGVRLKAIATEQKVQVDRSSGAAYLASRRKQRDATAHQQSDRKATVRRVTEELSHFASETTARSSDHLALLVARSDEDAFLAAVDNVKAEGVELELTGPWPAYSFARIGEP